MRHSPAIPMLIALGLIFPTMTNAQKPPHGKPPQAAYDACKGKSRAATCQMQTPHGSMSGTCQTPPNVSKMVCVPKRHGQNMRPTGGQQQSNGNGQRQLRQHTVTQSDGDLNLYPATERPITQSEYSDHASGTWRTIRTNGISDHKTGTFPNAGNPHSISEQDFNIRVPKNPNKGNRAQTARIIGWAFNGVPFEPGAGEFYLGNRQSGWQYEALSGAVRLGLDHNHAHVQPSGKYHYHGLPTLLLDQYNLSSNTHSPQIGWAADGFPIYALYGQNEQGKIQKLSASYRLKSGKRPAGGNHPGGYYDGTFTKDFEYVEGLGDLDACNGKWVQTEEFPKGTYAYFLTENYPVIPRCLMGTYIADTR